MTKQQEIIQWFREDRSFDVGRRLFMKYGVNLSFKNVLNRAGNTPDNFKYLCYELARIAGISEPQYKQMLKVTPVAAVIEEKEIDPNTLAAELIISKLDEIDPGKLKRNKLIEVVKAAGIKSKSQKTLDLIDALRGYRNEKLKALIPDNVKRSFKLRDEFPFLKNKDCPGVLKELVADMLTTYDNFVEGHKKLVEASSDVDIARISQDVVENYLENRQIWDELEHFKKKGKILGKHPIFEWLNRKEEIGKLSNPDLVKLRDQLKNNIPRTRKLITDDPEHKQTEERKKRIEMFEKELEEVNRILNTK